MENMVSAADGETITDGDAREAGWPAGSGKPDASPVVTGGACTGDVRLIDLYSPGVYFILLHGTAAGLSTGRRWAT